MRCVLLREYRDSVKTLMAAQAFVIYCFFSLLISYLGGERSLLILLHGRPPKDPLFPLNVFQKEIDPSDPYTFLFLKRGILREHIMLSIHRLNVLTASAALKNTCRSSQCSPLRPSFLKPQDYIRRAISAPTLATSTSLWCTTLAYVSACIAWLLSGYA
jgi:hypothetical protein